MLPSQCFLLNLSLLTLPSWNMAMMCLPNTAHTQYFYEITNLFSLTVHAVAEHHKGGFPQQCRTVVHVHLSLILSACFHMHTLSSQKYANIKLNRCRGERAACLDTFTKKNRLFHTPQGYADGGHFL